MQKWRLLELKTQNAAMNMAIDEAMLVARTLDRSLNTLRLYRWKPSAISIGKNQHLDNEVNVENCRRLGIDVVRRPSGGGAVYHDAIDEITYSIVAKVGDLGARDVVVAYSKVYDGMRDALRLMGVTADFNDGDAKNCPNLSVKGRKISGSSQANKRDVVLQHGTLLLDADLEKMFTLLRVSWAKKTAEVVAVAKEKLTSIKQELGHAISVETAANAMISGFRNALGAQIVSGGLSEFELELAQKLYNDKYASDAWNLHGKTTIS